MSISEEARVGGRGSGAASRDFHIRCPRPASRSLSTPMICSSVNRSVQKAGLQIPLAEKVQGAVVGQ